MEQQILNITKHENTWQDEKETSDFNIGINLSDLKDKLLGSNDQPKTEIPNLIKYFETMPNLDQFEFENLIEIANHPNTKDIIAPYIIIYWEKIKDAYIEKILNINSNDKEKIAELLIFTTAAYEQILWQAAEIEESDSMLKFIETCSQLDNYYINLLTKKAKTDLAYFDLPLPDYDEAKNEKRFAIRDKATKSLDKINGLDFSVIQIDYDEKGPYSKIGKNAKGHYSHTFNLKNINYNGKIINFSEMLENENADSLELSGLFELNNLKIRSQIIKDFHFDFSVLPIRAQLQFLDYIKTAGKDDIAKMQEFSQNPRKILKALQNIDDQGRKKNYQPDENNPAYPFYQYRKNLDIETCLKNRFTSFLSMENDPEMISSILKISEISFEASQAIFDKYSEIVDTTEKVRNIIRENLLNQKDYSRKTEDQIIQNLLKKGKDLLLFYSKNSDEDPEKILLELDNLKTNLMLIAATFKTLKQENPDLGLEDLQGIETDITQGLEVSPQDQGELLGILKSNWDHPEFQTIYPMLREHMEESFKNPHIRYYIVRDQSGENRSHSILTFQRFEDVAPGIAYASGNNVHPSARGNRIGAAAQELILDQEVQNHIVIADAYPKSDIFQHYINKSGFVGVGCYQNYDETNEPYICMANDKPVNDRNTYFWRQKTPEEIINAAHQETIDPNHIVVEVKFGQTLTGDPRIDQQSQQLDNQAMSFLQPYFAQNFVITRVAKGSDGTLYFAMEQDQTREKIRVADDHYQILKQETAAV